jgi:DNA polymerase (family 10)
MIKFEEKYSNKEIAFLLRKVAAVYLLTNENRFKVIAYQKAADTVENLSRNLFDLWQEGKVGKIPGIGTAIASHLDEYFKNGHSLHFDSLLKKIPPAVFVLMRIPTIGPKKAFSLVKNLHLWDEKTVINKLKKACLEGKVAKIENFGEKSEKEILKAINLFEKKANHKERMPLPYAFLIAKEVIDYLKKHPLVLDGQALGSLRRLAPTIGDIDILVKLKTQNSKLKTTSDVVKSKSDLVKPQIYKNLIDYFTQFPKTIKIDNAGEKKASIIVSPNIQIDLRIAERKNYGSMLQYFTGSKTHNIKLREYALKKGYSLSEYGIKDLKTKKLLEFEKEEDFYRFLGLSYIPPELREGTDEIEVAENKKLPKLVNLSLIKGDLHLHSSFDLQPSHDLGEASYLEIVNFAKNLGYSYVGFADHNPKFGGDLTENEIINILKKRKEEVEKTLKDIPMGYFIGLEVDILPDGRLALPEKALFYVDYLIVSIHSVFSQDKETMTERILRALDFPKVKILGHPTGRLLGKREEIDVFWEAVFEKARKKNIALEINSYPLRLDLPDILVRQAKNFGVKFIIDTDAHSLKEMEGMFYGVSVARRGWLEKKDVLNTLEYEKLKKWVKS